MTLEHEESQGEVVRVSNTYYKHWRKQLKG